MVFFKKQQQNSDYIRYIIQTGNLCLKIYLPNLKSEGIITKDLFIGILGWQMDLTIIYICTY